MFRRFVKWFFGYAVLTICERDKEFVIDLCFNENIPIWCIRKNDEFITFKVGRKSKDKLLAILDKRGRKVYSVIDKGLLAFLSEKRNRAGILIGISVFSVIIILSSLFVWDVRIESDTQRPHNEILSELASVGCYKGRFIPTTDFGKICVEYLDRYKETAWISVNVKGSIAYVEVRDCNITPSDEEEQPQNIVAAYDGTIVSTSVYCGKKAVEDGNVVKKGDLLISGIVTNADESLRLCRADGVVNAIVDTKLSCYVPYKKEEEYCCETQYERKSLKFFNIEIPLKNNIPPDTDQYEVTKESNEAVIFYDIVLPLSIEREIYSQKALRTVAYSALQAENEAALLMKEKFKNELGGATILNIVSEGTHCDDGYTLECQIKCEMNIATAVDIYS